MHCAAPEIWRRLRTRVLRSMEVLLRFAFLLTGVIGTRVAFVEGPERKERPIVKADLKVVQQILELQLKEAAPARHWEIRSVYTRSRAR